MIPGSAAIDQALQRVPKAEDFVVVKPQVFRVLRDVISGLKGSDARWALGGDASEVVQGVNTPATSIEILAFGRESTQKVYSALASHFADRAEGTSELLEEEVGVERRAELGGETRQIVVKSLGARFQVGGVAVGVHGDLRIKIGEWDWGDPIEFEPAFVHVVGEKLPVMPLRLRSDIYFGLGWLDRVQLIHEANKRKHHHQR